MNREMIKGVWYTTGAFLLWGVLPLYWRALIRIPSTQILAHRVFWSFAFVASLTIIQKRWKEVKYAFSSKRNRITFLSSSTALGINWFIYIWAVNAGHVVDTSLGYFINPLFSVFLGAVFLRERLKFWKMVAISLALSGVAYLTYQFGKIPWISLSLALSFGTYGLLRKTARVDSHLGLTAEMSILSPIALIYLVVQVINGKSSFGSTTSLNHFLLVFSGVVTSMPLLWFAHGAQRIPLSTVGFIQYLVPSSHLFIGVVVFQEQFTLAHLLSFCLIWCAIIIYSLSHTPIFRKIESSLLSARRP